MLPNIFRHTSAQVLYCPLAIPASHPTAAENLALRDEFETARDAVVIVQVGRMETLKGHASLLHALARLRDRNWTCWQVGGAQRAEERTYVDDLRRLAAELDLGDRVKFLGRRSDVARILDAADIYCQPNSEADAFGLSFIEALGAQLPIVTTALGGALEIVDDGCGLLVAPNDAIALAAALARLIDDPDMRHRLGAAGPARATALCDPAVRIQQLAAAIEGL
jgi:glycosyltransferase involved in cell wall biosynthesis